MSVLSRLFRRPATDAAPVWRVSRVRKLGPVAVELDTYEGDVAWLSVLLTWISEHNGELPSSPLAACAVCGDVHEGDTLLVREAAWSDSHLLVCAACEADPGNSGLLGSSPRPAPEAYGPQALAAYAAWTARRRNGDWS